MAKPKNEDQGGPAPDSLTRLRAMTTASEIPTEDLITEVKRWVAQKLLDDDMAPGGLGQIMHGLADLRRAEKDGEDGGGDIWRLLQELKKQKEGA